MKSTGEVMGIGDDFATAFEEPARRRECIASVGAVLVAVDDDDKPGFLPLIERLSYQGFKFLRRLEQCRRGIGI